MTSGKLENEVEVNVAASEVWNIYGTLQIGKLVQKEFSNMVQKIEASEGDGGVGTILHVTFAPGLGGPTYQKEKITKVDHEKRIKEAEVFEGDTLEMGFTLFRSIFEVIEKGEGSCIIKSSIEYELKEDAKADASFVSHIVQMLGTIAESVKNRLSKN